MLKLRNALAKSFYFLTFGIGQLAVVENAIHGAASSHDPPRDADHG